MQHHLSQLARELKLRGYSPRTIEAYTRCCREYFLFAQNKAERYDAEQLKRFVLQLQGKNLATATVNLYIQSVNYFYCSVCRINLYQIPVSQSFSGYFGANNTGFFVLTSDNGRVAE